MTTTNPTAPVYCSEVALQAGEPLIGSATPTIRYVLLEYPRAWGEKALKDSDLPEAVKQQLDSFAKRDPLAKVLLIRRPGSIQSQGPRLFLASVDERSPALYGFSLDNYEDLLSLDLPAFFAAPRGEFTRLIDDPVFLVCTNGRRDPCCALRGVPVFGALSLAAATDAIPHVWESTHVGGHRFAANLIVLPHGLLYGRVEPESALEILSAAQNGQVYLPNLRGRTAYPPPAQAADHFLRSQTGERSLDAYTLEQIEPIDDGEWQVIFRRRLNGRLIHMHVQSIETDQTVYDSCRLDKTTTFMQYNFLLDGSDLYD